MGSYLGRINNYFAIHGYSQRLRTTQVEPYDPNYRPDTWSESVIGFALLLVVVGIIYLTRRHR
jgi:carbohydrate-binding DOMON domain-containing protein